MVIMTALCNKTMLCDREMHAMLQLYYKCEKRLDDLLGVRYDDTRKRRMPKIFKEDLTMKNLKKVLALALVFAMTLTLFAGAAFSDQATIGADYADDVNMLVELGVLNGYEDNTFRPENNVTRAEFAKMAYTLKYGADDKGLLFAGSPSAFSDVEGVSSVAWAKGYINYCANQKIIAGVGNGKFNPGGNVTVAEAAKMLLVILGCNPQTEGFVGLNWQGNVVAKAIELGVFDGWSGDPTQAASRQLVAKLMRNTVFAPVYVYSPITGAGSQKQVLHPELDNPTLGEETMGLQHVTGIVVANEFNSIYTDGDGAPLGDDTWEIGDGWTGTPINPTGKEQTRIYFEEEDANGNIVGKSIYLPDISVSDDMLGNLVDVYFTYETKSQTSKINVIGNVLVNSKTVVYDVAADDIEIMPNGEAKRGSDIRPYISAKTADGEEITIEAPAGTARVPVTQAYNGAAFLGVNMFYSLNAARNNLDAASSIVTSTSDAVLANMGTPVPTSYRLVSIDGGKTISYIFSNPNFTHGVVNYNESKGTVTGSAVVGNATEVGEEVVVYDGLKKGDYVVATFESGKVVLHPTTTVTGAVSSYSKNTAVINGETYVGSVDFLNGAASLSAFYNGVGNKYVRGASYITYGNLLLAIDEDADVEISLDGYAVVLESSRDAYTDEAKVRLGMADGSEETYFVTYFKDGNNAALDAEENEEQLANAFDDNALCGEIVAYSLRDGKAEIVIEDGIIRANAGKVDNGALTIGGQTLYAEDGSVMFLLYNQNANTKKITFKTYKLDDMETIINAAAINTKKDANDNLFTDIFVNAMKTSTNSNDVMIGVMSAGMQKPDVVDLGDNVGLIIESVYEYDASSRKHYLDLALVSMGDAAVLSGKYMDVTKAKLSGVPGDDQEGNAEYAIGNIVNFIYDGSEFTSVSARADGKVAAQEGVYSTGNDGFYKVTITEANDKRISFYNYGSAKNAGDAADQTLQTHEYIDLKVVAIQDNEVVGDDIEELSRYDGISATDYNAIIEVMDGQIIKVFSIQGNI
ncbi:MAG: S-layer homology domain-containing protein [Ruminococcaceae bacterium]|nr:S-layer homology domain-containing protein [Oscillospiraceae bacterium]